MFRALSLAIVIFLAIFPTPHGQAMDGIINDKVEALRNFTVPKKLKNWRESFDNLIKIVVHLYDSDSNDDWRSEATYVRWGHTECPPNGTRLVYSGYMGGSLYSQTSGPQNAQCLPVNPDWAHYDDSVQGGGKIYGAEYRFGGHTDLAESFFNKKTRGYDVPCAVCLTSRSPVLMVPGKNQCMDGWVMEYNGYLASSSNTDTFKTSVDYFCLDKDPQIIPGSEREVAGVLVHLVESVCGPLPCPPYENGRELTCAVCSKYM